MIRDADGALQRQVGVLFEAGTLGGWGGLLVPVRDHQKQIVALLVRLDEPGKGGKYQFLTSKSKKKGKGDDNDFFNDNEKDSGSMRDSDSIQACDEHGLAMVFTGVRHFRH